MWLRYDLNRDSLRQIYQAVIAIYLDNLSAQWMIHVSIRSNLKRVHTIALQHDKFIAPPWRHYICFDLGKIHRASVLWASHNQFHIASSSIDHFCLQSDFQFLSTQKFAEKDLIKSVAMLLFFKACQNSVAILFTHKFSISMLFLEIDFWQNCRIVLRFHFSNHHFLPGISPF